MEKGFTMFGEHAVILARRLRLAELRASSSYGRVLFSNLAGAVFAITAFSVLMFGGDRGSCDNKFRAHGLIVGALIWPVGPMSAPVCQLA